MARFSYRRLWPVAFAVTIAFWWFFSDFTLGSSAADRPPQGNYTEVLLQMERISASLKELRTEHKSLAGVVTQLVVNASRERQARLPKKPPTWPCGKALGFDVHPRSSDCPLAESAYERKMQALADQTKRVLPRNLPDWDPTAQRYAWDYLSPIYHCPNRERIGRFGDGGKHICDFPKIAEKENCVVYSFGVDSEVSFEVELLLRTKCRIYAFDHSIYDFPSTDKHSNHLDPAYRDRIVFHRLGFASKTGGQFISLQDVMHKYNHTYIDVLKVDIEQAEWDVFANLAGTFSELPIGQLSIELHLHVANLGPSFQLFSQLECMGVRPFMHELNINPCTWQGRPFAIEYSFIRPSLLPCEYDAARAEELYQKGVQKREFYLARTGGPLSVNPWDTTSEIYLWDWFPPLFNCPMAERLGGFGPSGRYVCFSPALRRDPCVVYSFGIGDGSFESQLLRSTQCVIFLIGVRENPIVEADPEIARRIVMRPDFSTSTSVPDIMHQLEHSFVDIVKFEKLHDSEVSRLGATPFAFGQLLLTMDYTGNGPYFEFIRVVEQGGLRPFMSQVDLATCAIGRRAVRSHYSLINRRSNILGG